MFYWYSIQSCPDLPLNLFILYIYFFYFRNRMWWAIWEQVLKPPRSDWGILSIRTTVSSLCCSSSRKELVCCAWWYSSLYKGEKLFAFIDILHYTGIHTLEADIIYEMSFSTMSQGDGLCTVPTMSVSTWHFQPMIYTADMRGVPKVLYHGRYNLYKFYSVVIFPPNCCLRWSCQISTIWHMLQN